MLIPVFLTHSDALDASGMATQPTNVFVTQYVLDAANQDMIQRIVRNPLYASIAAVTIPLMIALVLCIKLKS